ncbi:PepSY domain-containing protein [uncultured Methylibium sp.]|uniref:PepSY-associated TM helix domain-containing protein n=1 Tax=uncultured Methylibium sp. TaxID=381093 RepID=UPI0025DD359D|nr:PepSY domain-containing protein [uncultured Methylibium sp.]
MSEIDTPGAPASRAGSALQRVFWRLHFWAGLLTAPLVLFAAFTGLLYVFTPQIEARLHAGVDRVPAGTSIAQLDAQVAAARAAQPGWSVRSVLVTPTPGATTQVLLAPPAGPGAHAGHAGGHDPGLPRGRIVYVDPATARVVGSLAEMERFGTWAKKLHSSALQGQAWRWPIELAASWMLLMLATGVAMWWARRPLAGGSGRARWRRWHARVGIVAGGLLAVVLLTGLTWSGQAGERFRAAQRALDQSSPQPPRDLRSAARGDTDPLAMQAILERARAELPSDLPLLLAPPRPPDGVWRIDVQAGSRPTARATLALDAGDGRVLYRSGWDELPLLARATAIGIPLHRGEFGGWNQALLVVVALAAIFSVVSGVSMWWLRRPAGRWGAPPVGAAQWRSVPVGLWALAALLAWALPVFGVSVLVFAALELIVAASRRLRLPPPAAA